MLNELLRGKDIECYRAVPAWLDLALLSSETPLDAALEPCMDTRQLALQRILQGRADEAVRLMPNAYTFLSLGIADYNTGNYSAAVDRLQTAYDIGRQGRCREDHAGCKAFPRQCLLQSAGSAQYGASLSGRKAAGGGSMQDRDALQAIGYNTASAWIETGRYEDAYAWFSAQEQPTLMSLHKLAICCEKTGRREEALCALSRAEDMVCQRAGAFPRVTVFCGWFGIGWNTPTTFPATNTVRLLSDSFDAHPERAALRLCDFPPALDAGVV